MVGDPGIEPGVRLREGVTVPCHTLRPVAHMHGLADIAVKRVTTDAFFPRQPENPLQPPYQQSI